jgi:hypothetical protein
VNKSRKVYSTIFVEKTSYPLTRIGLAYEKHLKTFLPKMYSNLQKEGNLEKHVYEVQENTKRMMAQMIYDGLSPEQALEIAPNDILSLPPEPGQENNIPEISSYLSD